MRNCCLRYAVLSLFLTLVACARLPEYAKPRTIQSDGIPKSAPNAFTYRQLTTEDFRATSLPENLSAHAKAINAQSAISIRITADSDYSISRWSRVDEMYVGTVNHLAFEAVMMPDSSWWNPKINAAMARYVLQHEQIHFALTEIAARKLTGDARKWASNFSVIRQTPQEVRSEILEQIDALIDSAIKANQKRHLKFDKDTSLFYAPSWQAWWLEVVEKELRKTGSGTHVR
jgi:hypothetical protein